MADEKRMAGDYTIIQSIFAGEKEIVIGENVAAEQGQRYMPWRTRLPRYTRNKSPPQNSLLRISPQTFSAGTAIPTLMRTASLLWRCRAKPIRKRRTQAAPSIAACKAMTNPDPVPLGQYRGFSMDLLFDSFSKEYRINLKGDATLSTALGTDIYGNIVRLDNVLDSLESSVKFHEDSLKAQKGRLPRYGGGGAAFSAGGRTEKENLHG